MASLELIFRREALADIDREAIYYSQKDDDGRLVIRFLSAVDQAAAKAATNSRTWPRVYREFRRVHLYRFPFSIFYLTHRGRVEVFGLLHAKRNPSLLGERLRQL